MIACTTVLWVLRCVAIVFGVAGFVLFENEEREIHDRLVEWWVKLDDKRKVVASKSSAFVQGISRMASHPTLAAV